MSKTSRQAIAVPQQEINELLQRLHAGKEAALFDSEGNKEAVVEGPPGFLTEASTGKKIVALEDVLKNCNKTKITSMHGLQSVVEVYNAMKKK